MAAQYYFLPRITHRTKTLSSASRDFPFPLDNRGDSSLHSVVDVFPHVADQSKVGLAPSSSNGSLIEWDIDTSSFMNVRSLSSWEGCEATPTYSDRSSYESYERTIRDSYASENPLLHFGPDEITTKSKTLELWRQSTLLPPNIQDFEYRGPKFHTYLPTHLQNSPENALVSSENVEVENPLSKRSATPSQLEGYAEVLGARSVSRNDRVRSLSWQTTPSLSFSSTVDGSPTGLNMASSYVVKDSPADASDGKMTSTSDIRKGAAVKKGLSSGRNDTAQLASKQLNRKISGPEPNEEFPSIMNAGVLMEPRRKTPKPPLALSPTMPLPAYPAPAAVSKQPGSFFHWESDSDSEEPKLNKARSLLKLRAKDSSQNPTRLGKRGSKDSPVLVPVPSIPSIAPRLSNASTTTTTGTSQNTAHISFTSHSADVRTVSPPATLKKKSSVRSKRTSGSSNVRSKKATKAKTEPLKRPKRSSSGRRLGAWFRRLLC